MTWHELRSIVRHELVDASAPEGLGFEERQVDTIMDAIDVYIDSNYYEG